jgi:hypothetical protein
MRTTTKRCCFATTVSVFFLLVLPSAVAADRYSLDAGQIGRAAGVNAVAAKDGVIRIAWPRDDVRVTVDGMDLPPPVGLTSWAAFAPAEHGAMLMGDMVVFEDEVNLAMDAAFSGELELTALHNHFFFDEPDVYFMHIGGMGEPVKMAAAVKRIWDAIRGHRQQHPKPGGRFPGPAPKAGKLSAEPIAKTLGDAVPIQEGAVRVAIGREGTMHGVKVGSSMGLNTLVIFAGDDELASINGDFIMTAEEVQPVLRALRKADINIVSLHNHMVGEQPVFYFAHIWAKGKPEKLARSINSVLAAQKQAAAKTSGH